ncbi:helix-turn-helix protein [Solirubrobacter pauli]|uniref:Helix-turn-helix protein n=1 Tax=Solirubrobacter pauli TaxID=166793 RepID=A0A660LFH3_9ACTN|nr:helix-turn-helix transcriptional regulator [Solirubrobacter pauli]RKQ93046.1 helix-turn-helix protein [Solirubrobacter pauli]
MAMGPLAEFLRARREQVLPLEVGLADSGRRRVPGLRREEVALLAGISVAYYVRLEQGHDRRPSGSVVEALASALALDEEGRHHLHALVAATVPAAPPRGSAAERVRPELARLLDRHIDAPALILGARQDVLVANTLARTLLPSFAVDRNVVRDAFLDPATREVYSDLAEVQRTFVAALRAAAAAHPHDERFAALVGELSLASPAFQKLWAKHEARRKRDGRKRFAHPDVGELVLDHDAFVVEAAPHQRLIVFHADPATRDGERLALLRALAATALGARGASRVG